MVRHHVKNGKKKKPVKKEPEKTEETILKDLDRFAGSSEEEGDGEGPNDVDTDDESLDSNKDAREMQIDEEPSNDRDDNDDNGSSSDEDEYGVPAVNKKTATRVRANRKKGGHDSDDDDGDDDESEDDFDLPVASETGMAGAMARILGLAAPSKAKQQKAVVLSKTITPLQKLQKKEKEEHDAFRSKRKQRRDVNLTAMHIPLSAATSRPVLGKDDGTDMVANAMANEIEQESKHRRVATRGVVALFNTIAKHQQQRAQQQVSYALKLTQLQSQLLSKP